ncbi:hypothetical protein COCNU_scaffold003639G000010 [Cocos nucifera]|nr:hypothetical protein [Cocos nucifera]
MDVESIRAVDKSEGKAPTSFATSATPSGLTESINIQILTRESALKNPMLAKLLVEAMPLLVDKQNWRSRTMADMFSSFYSSLIKLWKEHGNCARELEEEWKNLLSFELEVTSVRMALSWVKEQEVKEFQGLEGFKNELLASSHLLYVIGFEDGRDAVSKVYPDLDLSCTAIPNSKGEEIDEEQESTKVALTNEAPTMPALVIVEPAPTSEGTILEPPPTSKE